MKLDNKEIQKRIELIKDELTDLQGQLKEEPKLESGWYRWQNGHKWLMYYSKDGERYGFNDEGAWCKGDFTKQQKEILSTDVHYLATKEEVEKALIKEAKRRGYKDGVKINNSNVYNDGDVCNYTISGDAIEWACGVLQICTTNCWHTIFKYGKWATIIQEKEMTQKEIEEELGYKIKIVS